MLIVQGFVLFMLYLYVDARSTAIHVRFAHAMRVFLCTITSLAVKESFKTFAHSMDTKPHTQHNANPMRDSRDVVHVLVDVCESYANSNSIRLRDL